MFIQFINWQSFKMDKVPISITTRTDLTTDTKVGSSKLLQSSGIPLFASFRL